MTLFFVQNALYKLICWEIGSQFVALFWKVLVTLGLDIWLEKYRSHGMLLSLRFQYSIREVAPSIYFSSQDVLPDYGSRNDGPNRNGAVIIAFAKYMYQSDILVSDKKSLNNKVLERQRALFMVE